MTRHAYDIALREIGRLVVEQRIYQQAIDDQEAQLKKADPGDDQTRG